MPKRRGNNPKRRIVDQGTFTDRGLAELARSVRYKGNSLHKKHHSDYGLDPPTNPRPNKSLCDGKRPVPLREATRLFKSGLKHEMVSAFAEGECPKYVWAVDEEGEAYEAKVGGDGRSYHGYKLGKDDKMMRRYVLDEWKKRCPNN